MSFSVAAFRLIDQFSRTIAAEVIGRQFAKSSTSVSANYRAACICRSRSEFIAKLGIVLEEADECVYWLELINRTKLLPAEVVAPLMLEARELRAIFGRSVATARANQRFKRDAHPNNHQINQITR